MRLEKLRAHGVGLWDVMESAQRDGSLDSRIRQADLRNLVDFVDRLPDLRAIAFNGKTAALHGRRQLADRPGVALLDLPSTSGAYASLSREAKRNRWLTLRDHLI